LGQGRQVRKKSSWREKERSPTIRLRGVSIFPEGHRWRRKRGGESKGKKMSRASCFGRGKKRHTERRGNWPFHDSSERCAPRKEALGGAKRAEGKGEASAKGKRLAIRGKNREKRRDIHSLRGKEGSSYFGTKKRAERGGKEIEKPVKVSTRVDQGGPLGERGKGPHPAPSREP